MRTHWNAINGLMMCKYFHKRFYESYPQHPVRFVEFLANSSDQTYFFNASSLYIYYHRPVISFLFKVYIFPKVVQICYFISCILWYFDFIQVAKRNQLYLGEQIATQMVKCLKIYGLKIFASYIWQQPLLLCLI